MTLVPHPPTEWLATQHMAAYDLDNIVLAKIEGMATLKAEYTRAS